MVVGISFSACNNNDLLEIRKKTEQDIERVTQKTFTYEYNEATGNKTATCVELAVENLSQTVLEVPSREGFIFNGWYLDWLFTSQVSDELGDLVIGEEIFETSSDKLFARWSAVDAVNYKILMVFVTEIYGTFEKRNGSSILVDFVMTETEKQICELVAMMFGQYANALMNGLVVFEVDTYFTTQTIGREHLIQGTSAWGDESGLFFAYMLMANNIPELDGLLDEYGSVITSFGINDYDNLLTGGAGYGTKKFAGVHLETLLASFIMNDHLSVQMALDFDYPGVAEGWESFMQLYLHEFVHTLEQDPDVLEYNAMDYHDVVKHYSQVCGPIAPGLGAGYQGISEIEVIRLFLLNRAEIDGRTVGIPNWFWLE